MSRTQCHKVLDLWSCNQLLVIQFCTSYWCLEIKSHFAHGLVTGLLCYEWRWEPTVLSKWELWQKFKFIRFGLWTHKSSLQYLWNEPLVYPVKSYLIHHILETFSGLKYSAAWFFPVLDSFSQFWTGKTGLSQFIPFRTGKTGFGQEKPNPDQNQGAGINAGC